MKTKLTFTFYAFTFLFAAFESYNNQMPLLTFLIAFLFISFAILFVLVIGGQNAYDELSNSFEFINKKYFDLIVKHSDQTKELAKYNRNHDKATGKFCKKDGTFKPKVKTFTNESVSNAKTELNNEIEKLEQPYTIKGKSIRQLCEENLGIKIYKNDKFIGYLCGYDKEEDSGKLTINCNQFIVGVNSNKLKWSSIAEWDCIFTTYKMYSYVSLPEVIKSIKKHRNIE